MDIHFCRLSMQANTTLLHVFSFHQFCLLVCTEIYKLCIYTFASAGFSFIQPFVHIYATHLLLHLRCLPVYISVYIMNCRFSTCFHLCMDQNTKQQQPFSYFISTLYMFTLIYMTVPKRNSSLRSSCTYSFLFVLLCLSLIGPHFLFLPFFFLSFFNH